METVSPISGVAVKFSEQHRWYFIPVSGTTYMLVIDDALVTTLGTLINAATFTATSSKPERCRDNIRPNGLAAA